MGPGCIVVVDFVCPVCGTEDLEIKPRVRRTAYRRPHGVPSPIIFLNGCNYLGDVLHFVVARPYYERAVARLPHDGRPRIVVFNWGGMVWASRGLVYDESDEVALPAGKQSTAWLASPSLAELSCGGFRAQPLWSHYYLVSFPC